MKIKLSELRKIIREEVERNLRWSAGYFGGDLSSPQKGINYVPLVESLNSYQKNLQGSIPKR